MTRFHWGAGIPAQGRRRGLRRGTSPTWMPTATALAACLTLAAVMVESPFLRAQPADPVSIDLDGDGIEDELIAEPAFGPDPVERGRVYVESGADGAVLADYEGATLYDYFGYAAAWTPDLDADGSNDLIVGSPLWWHEDRLGRAEVLSGLGEELLLVLEGQPGGTFGVRVEAIEDVNGDGIDDLLVAEHFYDQRRNVFEIEHVFSGADGATLSVQPDSAGRLVKLAADVNDDRTVDPGDVAIVSQQVGTTVQEGETNAADVDADGQVAQSDVLVVVEAYGQSVGGGAGGLEPAPVLPRLAEAPVVGLDPPPAFGTLNISHSGGVGGGAGGTGGGWTPPDGIEDVEWMEGGDGYTGDDDIDDDSDDDEDGEAPAGCDTRVTLSPKPKWLPFPQYPDDTLPPAGEPALEFVAHGTPAGGRYEWTVSGAAYRSFGSRCEVRIKRPGRVIVRVKYIKDCTATNSTRFVAFKADIDVDSDNDRGLGMPDGTVEEERIEDDPVAGPGKVFLISAGDTDGDGVPDFADGLAFAPGNRPNDWPWGGDVQPGHLAFVPVPVLIGGLPSGTEYTVRFNYNASDPAEVRGEATAPTNGTMGEPYQFYLPPGRLRLWKKPGDQMRDPADVADGGDFVVPGVEYTAADLGVNASTGRATLWLEAVRPSEEAAHNGILMTLTVTDGPEQIPASLLSDMVLVTAAELEVHDLRHWGPAMATPSNPNGSLPMVVHTDFDRPYALASRVGGAITDGASICLVRIVPPLGEELEWAVRIVKRASDFVERPDVFGGFTEGTDELPPLPVVSNPGQFLACERELVDGKAFYVPPDSYIDPTRTTGYSSYLNALETCDMDIEALIGGERMGAAPFLLRRPPLVLVHGLNSAPATWHSQAWNEMVGMPIPTRMYRVDWSATHLKGYAENFGHLGLMIRQALGEYRSGYDAGHAPARSFQGIRYAATRVDVVGHSMGGQIARMYISDLTGQHPRGGNWLNMNLGPRDENDPSGRWPYLRSDNYGAGDIRRLITLGSPFQGSAWADVVEDFAETPSVDTPAEEAGAALKGYGGRNRMSLPLALQELYDQHGVYDPPTAIADLTTTSAVNTLMRFARYPTGHKAVAWAPFVGIATPPGEPLPPFIYEQMLGWLPVFGVGFDQLPPDESDLVVHEVSQRNNLVGLPVPPLTFHVHLGPVRDDFITETSSVFMSENAGILLSGPRSGLLTGGLDR